MPLSILTQPSAHRMSKSALLATTVPEEVIHCVGILIPSRDVSGAPERLLAFWHDARSKLLPRVTARVELQILSDAPEVHRK